MITTVRQLLTCHWTGRRVQRYLDADPDVLLTPDEIARLEAHLASCERCAELAEQHRSLHWTLSTFSGRPMADPASVERVRNFLNDFTDGSES